MVFDLNFDENPKLQAYDLLDLYNANKIISLGFGGPEFVKDSAYQDEIAKLGDIRFYTQKGNSPLQILLYDNRGKSLVPNQAILGLRIIQEGAVDNVQFSGHWVSLPLGYEFNNSMSTPPNKPGTVLDTYLSAWGDFNKGIKKDAQKNYQFSDADFLNSVVTRILFEAKK